MLWWAELEKLALERWQVPWQPPCTSLRLFALIFPGWLHCAFPTLVLTLLIEKSDPVLQGWQAAGLLARVQILSTGKRPALLLLQGLAWSSKTAMGWSRRGGPCIVILLVGRRDCQKGVSGRVGDSEERGGNILLSLQFPAPPEQPPSSHGPVLGHAKAAKLPANVKADLS